MYLFRVLFISVGSCLLLLQAMAVSAGWFGADFSADVVQGTKQGQSASGRMYVSQGRVRTEIEQGEQSMVEIIDPGKGVAWLIDPKSRQYQVREVPRFVAGDGRSSSPCHGIEGAECRKLPDEFINGRSSQKWWLRINGKERLQWNDARHGFPTQVVEGGVVVMAMIYVGQERLDGRQVERWRAMQRNGKSVVESEQWYDPQLNIAIRQLAQDGSFRELRDIKLGEQADGLFAPPQGYSKVDAAVR